MFASRLKRPALILFFCSFAAYNLNVRLLSTGDTAPAALLPFSVLLDHAVTFDRYAPWFAERYGNAYFLRQAGGHFYSLYPIAQPLLMTPLYSPLLLVPGLRAWPVESTVLLARVLEKFMAALIAACAVTFFFVLARRFVETRHAVLLAIVFGFATNTWSTSSQALWQHGASGLLIVLSLLSLHRQLKGETQTSVWVGSGLFAALAVAVRPSNILFFGAACAVLLFEKRRWRLLASYALFGALIGGAVAAYNLRVFGAWRGGYALPFEGSLLSGMSGLLFSPGRGLFTFSPVLLFAIAGIIPGLRRGHARDSVYLICMLFPAGLLALFSKWSIWWGGDCFGPRLMADALPCLTLLLVPVLPVLARSKPAKAAFAVVLAFSIFVQFVGAFSYPGGAWDATPVPVSAHPERLWDWADNPIRRNLSSGIHLTGYGVLTNYMRVLATGRVPGMPANVHVQ